MSTSVTFVALSKMEITPFDNDDRKSTYASENTRDRIAVVSCECELFLLRETDFGVIVYLDTALHEFDSRLVYKMHT